MTLNPASENCKKKIQLYVAASWLFEAGKSHPQVIESLQRFESNIDLLETVVDRAMFNTWDKLSEEAHQMFANGVSRDIIIEALLKKEPDREIVTWLCDDWYNLKLAYMECLNDGPTNVFDGVMRIIVSGLGILVMFLIDASWFIKTIWIIFFLFSFTQWAVGLMQNRIARRLNRLLTVDGS